LFEFFKNLHVPLAVSFIWTRISNSESGSHSNFVNQSRPSILEHLRQPDAAEEKEHFESDESKYKGECNGLPFAEAG
jgi:hypothetical protein